MHNYHQKHIYKVCLLIHVALRDIPFDLVKYRENKNDTDLGGDYRKYLLNNNTFNVLCDS